MARSEPAHILDLGLRTPVVGNPTGSENRYMGRTRFAVRIDTIYAVIRGSGTSISFNIAFSTDRSAGSPTLVFASSQVANSKTTGNSFSSFANATIPAGNHVWLVTTAIVGTISELGVQLDVTGLF